MQGRGDERGFASGNFNRTLKSLTASKPTNTMTQHNDTNTADRLAVDSASTGSSPVCGNCNKPLSAHYHEDEEYCFSDTNGDIFTDEPQDWMVMDMIDDKVIEAA